MQSRKIIREVTPFPWFDITEPLPTTPCWEWPGRPNGSGYGQIRLGRRVFYTHRWTMARAHGWEAIDGWVVMHLCDNKICFRLDHLRVGTLADNAADRDRKGRHASVRRRVEA